MSVGCGNVSCTNTLCCSNPAVKKMDANTAAAKALPLLLPTIHGSVSSSLKLLCTPNKAGVSESKDEVSYKISQSDPEPI